MTQSEISLETSIKQHALQGEVICQAIIDAIGKTGLETQKFSINFNELDFSFIKDPFDGRMSLRGDWRDQRGYSKGSIIFYPDGNFYAEYDVIKPHPLKKQFFIEAMTAWGKGDEIKTEARLMEVLG